MKSHEDVVKELTQRQQSLTEAMQRLIRFQRQTLVLKSAPTIDAALDTMESLLIEVIDFAYASLQCKSDDGVFSPLRQTCPESFHYDYPLMEWVMGTQEVSLLPIDAALEGDTLRSVLFLPLGAHHILLLWREQDTEAFTREQEALLSILSREVASVLDAQYFRMRLEKTRAAMSDLIESVPLGLLALDHQGAVQMLNSTAELALGVSREDVAGLPYRTALPAKAADLVASLLEETVHGEAEFPVEGAGREPQCFGVSLAPMRSGDGSGKAGQVIVFRDLQLSREVQKLRELDSMKNDFLSLVTHELRTPLTGIMSSSETLMMDESESVPAEWREYIGTIHEEGKRLTRLIDDVLDMTRMGAGEMVYDYERQDPNELIGSVVMSLTSQFEQKGHDLELDLGEDIGECKLSTDRFTQVLLNVVSNAVRYTDDGGRIVITSRREAPLPGTSVPSLLVTVEDNGVGIAPENLEKVFSKFEIGTAVKHHSSGTGLGMAICKQIIEDGHHGKIWIESELGKGTKVSVQIPME